MVVDWEERHSFEPIPHPGEIFMTLLFGHVWIYLREFITEGALMEIAFNFANPAPLDA